MSVRLSQPKRSASEGITLSEKGQLAWGFSATVSDRFDHSLWSFGESLMSEHLGL
jgi:hypothetical protein